MRILKLLNRLRVGSKAGGAAQDRGRRCLLFATWIPESALRLGDYYLKTLQRYFPDTDIYIGINHGSHPDWERRVRRSGLKAVVGLVPESGQVDSDVAGFQEALRLLRDSGRRYDAVWFAHSKGASYANFRRSRAVRSYFEKRFWSRREALEELLFSAPEIGLVANRLMMNREQELNDHCRRLTEFFPFPFQSIGYFAVETFYLMRGNLVQDFLEQADPRFFECNLVKDLGFNRWFFEAVFVSLCDRMGYEPRAADEAQDRFLVELAKWRSNKGGHLAQAVKW